MRRTPTLLHAVCLTAIVAIAWALRLVWAGQTGYGSGMHNSWDLRLYFYPFYDAAYSWLAAGILPIWNPYQLCGIPWIATLLGGFFYPPHVLYLLLPTHVGLASLGLLHLLFIALSTAVLARRVGLTPAAATLAALLFTLHDRVRYLLLWPSHLEAVSWLALGCLAIFDLARGKSTRAVGLLGLATGASLLAGDPQHAVFLFYAWGSLLVALLLGARATPGRWITTAGLFAAGLFIGALASGIQMLPAFELAQLGTRTTQTLSVGTIAPGSDHMLRVIRDTLTGSSPSFGVLALSLAPAALFARRHRALALWAFFLALVTFAFALGPETPLFSIYRALPALGWFRFPERILVLSDFAIAILAAIGLDAIRAKLRAPDSDPTPHTSAHSQHLEHIRSIALLALPVMGAIILGARMAILGSHVAASLALVTATTLAIGTWRKQRCERMVAGILLTVGVIEVLTAPANPARLPYDKATAAAYHAQSHVYTLVGTMAGPDRVWMMPLVRLGQARKLASYYRLRLIDDYEPVSLRRQANYLTYFMEGSTRFPVRGGYFVGWLLPGSQSTEHPPWPTRRRLLDLAAVRFLMIPPDELTPNVRALIDSAGFLQRVLPDSYFRLFENPHAAPRAFAVYRVLPAPPVEELLGLLSRRDFDPLVESYVEGDPGLSPPATAPPHGQAAAIVRDEERIVEVEATLTAPGLVVLADSFYPGWRATVDGEPAAILPTNYLFRGVPVTAGRHLIRFEYRPWTVTAGAAASFLGLLATAVLLLRRQRTG